MIRQYIFFPIEATLIVIKSFYIHSLVILLSPEKSTLNKVNLPGETI